MQTTLFSEGTGGVDTAASPNYLAYEPFIYFGLGLHGLVILGFLGGTIWAWTAVILTIVLGLSFFVYKPFTPLRPATLVGLTWLLVYATGGSNSFLQLWFFIIAPLYSFILERPYGSIFPFVLAFAYFTFIVITPAQIPEVVLLARTALHLTLGWLAYKIGSSYRETISANMETHRALRLSSERFVLAARVANLYFWFWEIPEDRVTRIEMGETLLGHHTGENRPTLDGFFANVHPEDVAAVKAAVFQSVAEQEPYFHEFRVIDKNGHIRWLKAHGRVDAEGSGEPSIMVGLSQDITEAKAASLKLEEQAQLLNIVSDAVIATDSAFHIQSWNKAAESMYGWRKEEVVGKSMGEVVPTAYLDQSRDEVLQQYMAKGIWQGDAIQTRKDGQQIDVLASVTAVKDDSGAAIGAIAVNRDITGRRNAERALQENEALYRTLVETLPLAILVVDLDFKIIFANQALAFLLGAKSPREVIDPIKWELVPEQTMPLIQERIARIQNNEANEPVSLHLKRLDGQDIVVESRTVPVVFQGKAASLVMMEDVSVRTRFEEAQKKFTHQLARAHEIAQIATWEWNLQTNEVIWSNEMYRLLGLEVGSPSPTLETNLSYIHPQDRQIVINSRLGTKENGQVSPIEFRITRADGEVRQLWADGEVTFDEPGRPETMLGILQDVTERRKTEKEILQRNREMTSLLQISQQISQLLELDNLVEVVLATIVDTIHQAEAASAWLYEAKEDKMIPLAWKNHRDEEIKSLALSPETSLVGQVYRERKAVNIPDTAQNPFFQALRRDKMDEVQSVIGVPVILQDKVAMILFADCFSQTNAFSEADLRWMESLTGQTAVMMQNARLFAEEKRARQTAEILQAANLALTQTLNLDTILRELLVKLEQLIPYDTANVMLVTGETEVRVYAQRGVKIGGQDQKKREIAFDIHKNWTMNQVIVNQKSTIIPNTRQEPRWEIRPGAEHVMSWMGIPLIFEGASIGLYAIDKSEPDYFAEEHLQLAEALSAQAAVAIRNAQLLDALHNSQEELHALTDYLQSAREDERKRISHEIHDEFGQLLTAIKMNLAWLHKQCSQEDQPIIEKIETTSALGDQAIGVARRVARELRPGLLDDLGLAAALEWHLQEFTKHTNILTSLAMEPDLQIEQTDLALTIYRIVQEGLTNVARHAQATEVQVALFLKRGRLELSIQDNGVGITDAQKVGKQSLGLLGIRERARTWQGKVRISGRKDMGTSIIVQIPEKSLRIVKS